MSDDLDVVSDTEETTDAPSAFKQILSVMGDWPIAWSVAALALGAIAVFLPSAGAGVALMAVSGLIALIGFALGIRAIGANRRRALAIVAMAISVVVILFYILVALIFVSVASKLG